MTVLELGKGAYTPAEAARLLRVPPGKLRRWILGYSYRQTSGNMGRQEPLWPLQYAVIDDEPILGFRDLIEARTIHKLRAIGLGLPTIRECLKAASEIAGDSHPFSTKRLKTDGKRLYLELMDSGDRIVVIDLKNKQHAFSEVIKQTFLDLEFDGDVAARWWLNPDRRTLVIDPERSFGQPITAREGIPTYRLAQAVRAEGSVSRVARIFDVDVKTINDAIRFEDNLKAAA